MDAVKFIKEWNRMLEREGKDPCTLRTPEELVSFVDKWAKENPPKTRQDEFLKQWPNIMFDYNGVISIDPCILDSTMRSRKDNFCYNGDCGKCRRKFWMQEVE